MIILDASFVTFIGQACSEAVRLAGRQAGRQAGEQASRLADWRLVPHSQTQGLVPDDLQSALTLITTVKLRQLKGLNGRTNGDKPTSGLLRGKEALTD